jgi:hypothetical protein
VKWSLARIIGVTNKNAEKGLVPKKPRVDWDAARKMGVALVPQKMGVEYGIARLIGVAVAKAELNKTVHQVCTVDFTPKPFHPALLSACVLERVVVFSVQGFEGEIGEEYSYFGDFSKFFVVFRKC